jgi:hypothetical protein
MIRLRPRFLFTLGALAGLITSCMAADEPVAPAQTTPAEIAAPALPNHLPVYVSESLQRRSARTASISISLAGVKKLYLVVKPPEKYAPPKNAAYWVEPRFVGPAGMKRLSDLPLFISTTAEGEISKNKTLQGRPLMLEGETVEYGFGVMAPSVIGVEVPEGYAQFLATASVDPMEPGKEVSASVRFLVFTDQPGHVPDPTNAALMSAMKEKALQDKREAERLKKIAEANRRAEKEAERLQRKLEQQEREARRAAEKKQREEQRTPAGTS